MGKTWQKYYLRLGNSLFDIVIHEGKYAVLVAHKNPEELDMSKRLCWIYKTEDGLNNPLYEKFRKFEMGPKLMVDTFGYPASDHNDFHLVNLIDCIYYKPNIIKMTKIVNTPNTYVLPISMIKDLDTKEISLEEHCHKSVIKVRDNEEKNYGWTDLDGNTHWYTISELMFYMEV